MSLNVVSSFNGVTDPDAGAYIAAVEAADGLPLEFAVGKAINDFVVGCKADGIWDAIKASCILAGARTFAGALIPLKGTAPTKFGTEGNWNYNRKDGLQGDGSTNYLNSNRSQTADPQNNHHLATQITTTGTGTIIGARADILGDSSVGLGAASTWPFRSRISTFDGTSQGTRSTVGATGLLAISRSSSSSLISRLSSANETINSASTTPLTGNIGIFARIRTDTSTVDSFSDARLAFYSIGESLDLARLDSRVTDLMAAFNNPLVIP